MRYFDLTLPTLEANLALDEVLLDTAEQGGSDHEALRFWEHPAHAVVLGSACRVRDEVLLDACRRDGIPLARRTTGGGTVLIGPGCLNIALVLCYERCPALGTIQGASHYVFEQTVPVVQDLVGKNSVSCAGLGDLCLDDRKIGGSAQRRRHNALLYHGSLLYDFDLELVSRYLAEPQRQPDYRRQRTHEDFLANGPIDPAAFKRRLAQAWNAEEVQTDWPQQQVARLVAERFSNPAWTFRR